jgi:hypothetical protein
MSQVPSEFVRRRAAAVASMELAGIFFSLTRALADTTVGA